MAIRILVADDHAVFRSGLKALLEKESDLQVVAETGDGFETIKAIETNEIDLLILDISMPGLPGTRVAETVKQEHPHLAIVVLTMHEDDYYLREMLRIGVRAFVLKKSTGTNLLQAIRMAYRGNTYLDPSLAGQLVPSYIGGSSKKDTSGELELLTAREKEVCTLLAYGFTNREIAERLFVSNRTVETHRAHIMAKLNLKTRAELVRIALANHLLKFQ